MATMAAALAFDMMTRATSRSFIPSIGLAPQERGFVGHLYVPAASGRRPRTTDPPHDVDYWSA